MRFTLNEMEVEFIIVGYRKFVELQENITEIQENTIETLQKLLKDKETE